MQSQLENMTSWLHGRISYIISTALYHAHLTHPPLSLKSPECYIRLWWVIFCTNDVFCKEKDDKDHFLACPQAAGIGDVTREILLEFNLQRKAVSWQQLGLLDLNLPLLRRLPALVLISELVIQIHQSRSKGKSLELEMLTSTLRLNRSELRSLEARKTSRIQKTSWSTGLKTSWPASARTPWLSPQPPPPQPPPDAHPDNGNARPGVPNGPDQTKSDNNYNHLTFSLFAPSMLLVLLLPINKKKYIYNLKLLSPSRSGTLGRSRSVRPHWMLTIAHLVEPHRGSRGWGWGANN